MIPNPPQVIVDGGLVVRWEEEGRPGPQWPGGGKEAVQQILFLRLTCNEHVWLPAKLRTSGRISSSIAIGVTDKVVVCHRLGRRLPFELAFGDMEFSQTSPRASGSEN
jgi:hypothetical protein